jgi:hypothetical protein
MFWLQPDVLRQHEITGRAGDCAVLEPVIAPGTRKSAIRSSRLGLAGVVEAKRLAPCCFLKVPRSFDHLPFDIILTYLLAFTSMTLRKRF